jgi:hypothetical protein
MLSALDPSRSFSPGDSMSVLMRLALPHMPRAAYDQMSTHVTSALKNADGFHHHIAVEQDGGMAVMEVWDSQEQWKTFFDGNIKPNMPADAPEAQPEFYEVAGNVAR